jgi:hypothetical protein
MGMGVKKFFLKSVGKYLNESGCKSVANIEMSLTFHRMLCMKYQHSVRPSLWKASSPVITHPAFHASRP